MKKLVLIATLALAGCNDEQRQLELNNINTKLPEGCAISDMGYYANISHVLVVVCKGAKTISTNASWTKMVGKVIKKQGGVTFQIEEN
jgi:hypothetical protein